MSLPVDLSLLLCDPNADANEIPHNNLEKKNLTTTAITKKIQIVKKILITKKI